jgi:hypothetical protein
MLTRFCTRAHPIWLVFLVALAARLLVFSAACQDAAWMRFFDADEYERLAANLLDYRVFSKCDLQAGREPVGPMVDAEGRVVATAGPYLYEVTRTPGYPAFLAVIYAGLAREPAWVAFWQCGLGTVTCVLTYALVAVVADRTCALWAGLLLACDVSSMAYCNLIASETLFAALFTAGGVLLFCGRRHAAWQPAGLAGIAWGLAVLCRPVGLYATVLAGTWLVIGAKSGVRRRLGTAVAFGGLLFATVGPWVYRNYVYFGAPAITNIQGLNLFSYKAVHAEIEPPVTWERTQATRARMHAEFAAALGDRRCNALEMSREYERAALQMLFRHPSRYLAACGKGAVKFLVSPAAGTFLHVTGTAGPQREALTWASAWHWLQEAVQAHRRLPVWCNAVVFGACLVNLTIYAGALIAVTRSCHDAALRPYVLFLAATAAYFCLIAGPQGNARFRLPAMPALCALAGIGLVRKHRGDGTPRLPSDVTQAESAP